MNGLLAMSSNFEQAIPALKKLAAKGAVKSAGTFYHTGS